MFATGCENKFAIDGCGLSLGFGERDRNEGLQVPTGMANAFAVVNPKFYPSNFLTGTLVPVPYPD